MLNLVLSFDKTLTSEFKLKSPKLDLKTIAICVS